MLTNKEIVIWIYENVDIPSFVTKVISKSILEDNYNDLVSYIYLYLLEYDNTKLNALYDDKSLPQFIMRIILNQRNYYKSYYNEYCKFNDLLFNDLNVPDEEHYYYDEVKNRKIEFISKELNKYANRRRNLTDNEMYEMYTYEFYRIYLTRDYTLKELSEKFKMGYNTVVRLISEAKTILKNKYESEYGNDDNPINNKCD